MYRRTVSGRTLTFGVSGKLWKNALVMYDRETNSLWSHLTGKCIWGAYEGEQLETIASMPKMKWQDWKSLHPDTQVLSVNGHQDVRSDTYADYHRSRRTGLFEPNRIDERLPEKALVIGIKTELGTKAYPLHKKYWRTRKKQQWRVIQDRLFDLPLLVYHDPENYATSVYDRRLADGSVINFTSPTQGYMATDTAGTQWNLLTGKSESGQRLSPVPHMNIYWFAWSDFYPETALWQEK